MLDLGSPEWGTIKASSGGDGVLTARLLAQLADGDESAWGELYQQVCHQNSVGEVAFVAAPHLVAIARAAPIRLRTMLLGTIGAVVASRKCYPRSAAKPRAGWNAEFERACADARALTSEALKERTLDRDDSMLLIGTLAALHDHAHLALLLQDGPEFSCPECGKPIRYGE